MAAHITARSADAILEMARRLVATTDDTLFGDTEFQLRDQALGIVADAYTEHLPKKRYPPPPPSTAPTADGPPPSTATAKNGRDARRGGHVATGPITTAEFVAKDSAPGTTESD